MHNKTQTLNALPFISPLRQEEKVNPDLSITRVINRSIDDYGTKLFAKNGHNRAQQDCW